MALCHLLTDKYFEQYSDVIYCGGAGYLERASDVIYCGGAGYLDRASDVSAKAALISFQYKSSSALLEDV